MSHRIRNEFRFDFGSIPLPSCHGPCTPTPASSSSSTIHPRFSVPPESMTTNDHQLLGEYKNGAHHIKVTYNHTKIDGVIYKHTLINPFVLTIGQETGHIRYIIRDTPDKLFVIGKTMTQYEKTGPILEKKCNFAFNSMKNAFLFLVAMEGNLSLEFRERVVKTTDSESEFVLVNPLTCRVQDKWYFMDLRRFVLHSIDGNVEHFHTLDIVDMDERVRILTQASDYYVSDRQNEI